MAVRIHLNAVTPYTLTYVLTSSTFDLSTASAASFLVRRPDGSLDTWTAVISAPAVGSVTLTRTFLGSTGPGDEADVARIGDYQLYPSVVLAGPTTVIGTSITLTVFDPYTGLT